VAQVPTESMANTKRYSPPKISINWRRYWNDPAADLKRALTETTACASYGSKGKGKSALIESLADRYKCVFDLFGSRDNEGLAWCRSHRQDSILFLKGASTDIESSWPSKNANAFKLEDLEKYATIISCNAFYANIREEWRELSGVMDTLWNRDYWDTICSVVIREAANLLYSRVQIGDSQQQAKNYIIYTLREMRHCGIALEMDSIRWFAIDIDVRTIADYTFLKAQGTAGLPHDLWWLYRFYKPSGVMRMGVEKFIVVSRDGPIGEGDFELPYWHKQPKEHMLKLFGIKTVHGDVPNLGDKGGQVGDYEHVDIMVRRTTTHASMEAIGRAIGRSSRTVHMHIEHHNRMVREVGTCDKCTRVRSHLAQKSVA
jgi:hypothetical protein